MCEFSREFSDKIRHFFRENASRCLINKKITKNCEKLPSNQVNLNFFSENFVKSHLLPRFLPISRSNFAVNFSSSTSHSSWTRFKTFFSSFSLCSINCLYNLKTEKNVKSNKFRKNFVKSFLPVLFLLLFHF